MRYIDLTNYYNRRWIRRGEDMPDSDEEWTLDERYLQNGKIESAAFSFLMAAKGNDVMECDGQYIPVPSQTNLQYIDIAAFCVFGFLRDTFTLYYDDKTTETVKLSFRDIVDPITMFMSKDWQRYYDFGTPVLAFTYETAEEVRHCTIFANRIRIKRGKRLVGIRMPNNILIRICGITVGE